MNRLEIIGNLTAEPVTRTVNTQSGTADICSFTVAAKNNQSKTDDTQFIRVSAWYKLGEICAQYLHKGNKVYVAGAVSCHAYTGQDGQPRAQMEISAGFVEFLTPKAQTERSEQSAQPAQSANYGAFTPVDDGDLPF